MIHWTPTDFDELAWCEESFELCNGVMQQCEKVNHFMMDLRNKTAYYDEKSQKKRIDKNICSSTVLQYQS